MGERHRRQLDAAGDRGAVVLPSDSAGVARSWRAAAAGVGAYRGLGFTAFGEITEYKPKGGSP
jgi:hypothetical protein